MYKTFGDKGNFWLIGDPYDIFGLELVIHEFSDGPIYADITNCSGDIIYTVKLGKSDFCTQFFKVSPDLKLAITSEYEICKFYEDIRGIIGRR